MESRYISGKELLKSKILTYKELIAAIKNGNIEAFSQQGDTILEIKFTLENLQETDFLEFEQFKDIILNDYLPYFEKYKKLISFHGSCDLDDKDILYIMYMSLYLDAAFELDKTRLKEHDSYALFPFDITSAVSLGYDIDKYKNEIESFLFIKSEIEDFIYNKPKQDHIHHRRKRSYLTMIAAFLHKTGISPDDKHAVRQVKTELECLGLALDDDTIKGILKEIQAVRDAEKPK